MAMRKTATLALSLCLWSVAVGAAGTTAAPRGALEECRPPHCDDTVPEQNVDAGDPVPVEEEEEGNVDRNDFFCLPNGDGFVGTIEGSSYIVPYAFGLETEGNADIVDVLRDIKMSVEDYLIRLMIPDACEGRRQLQQGDADVLGFRFEKEMDLLSVACTPLIKPDAACGIFEGVIQVFGSGGGILSKVQNHLNDPKTIDANFGILRIFSTVTSDPSLEEEDLVEGATEAPIDFSNNPSKLSNGGGGLTGGAIAGIVIAVLLVLVGISGLLFFQHRRRNKVRATEDNSIHSQVYFDKDGDVGSVPTLGVEDGRPTYEYNLR